MPTCRPFMAMPQGSVFTPFTFTFSQTNRDFTADFMSISTLTQLLVYFHASNFPELETSDVKARIIMQHFKVRVCSVCVFSTSHVRSNFTSCETSKVERSIQRSLQSLRFKYPVKPSACIASKKTWKLFETKRWKLRWHAWTFLHETEKSKESKEARKQADCDVQNV